MRSEKKTEKEKLYNLKGLQTFIVNFLQRNKKKDCDIRSGHNDDRNQLQHDTF